MDWIAAARAGNPRAVARLITQVENDAASAPAVVRALYAATGRSHVVGITGPPGSGKSSLVNELAKRFRQRDRRVGIVAVDPSSPFTGGALLGDRVRMRDLAGDAGIFVRSMASRGNLGGLARSTADAVKVLDAAGYDLILIETVGAGQAEVDIASAAHTVVVIEAPGMGDDVQSIKAGILEIADILVVNKADRPGASRTARSLEMMLHLGLGTVTAADRAHHGADATPPATDNGRGPDAGWATPVLQTVATTGEGVAELVAVIERHGAYLTDSGRRAARDWERSRDEIERLLRDLFMSEFHLAVPAAERTHLISDVAERRLDPYSAAERLFASAATYRSER
jgi:LAO/AO transport system kinase